MFQHRMLKGFSFIWLFFYLLPVYAEGQQVNNAVQNDKGALCLIRADNKILLINEIITKQLSIPGGTIRTGEPPELAAQRETWEESGLVVAVGDVLGHTEQAIVFDCVSSSEILAYQHQNSIGGYELPVWFAPDYGIEVASATLVDPAYIQSQFYRYPDDWATTFEMFNQATNQDVRYVANLINMAPDIHQRELVWIQQFQLFINSLPEAWNKVIHRLLMMGDIFASPVCGIILLPLLYWRCGKAVCYKVSFAISITSLLCLFAQQGFSLPRPHVYFPSLQLSSSYGNGFPSLPITVWSSIGVLLIAQKGRLSGNWFVLVYVLSAIWLMLSKFYLGGAFILDMVVGGLLGLLISWNIVRFDIKSTEKARTVMGSRRVWWSITLVAAIFTYYWQLPVFAAWLMVLIVVSIITTTLKKQRDYLSLTHTVIFIVLLSLVYAGISYVSDQVTFSGIYPLVIETVRYPIIIIAFVIMLKLTAPQKSDTENLS